MRNQIQPVLLAGGSGTRLWPLSREARPKQFLQLLSNQYSLFQQTVRRCMGNPNTVSATPLVICAESHRFLVAQQLIELEVSNPSIFLEPEGKNTAAAVACAAKLHLEEDPLLWVLPSDHAIDDSSALHDAITKGVDLANDGGLVVFGIKPTHPETGYGYIHGGNPIGKGYEVLEFCEKPSVEIATKMVSSGAYSWNSGMILARASTLASELEQHAPDIWNLANLAASTLSNDHDFQRPDADAFSQIPSMPFDTAVLEKSSKTVLVELDAGWSDVGTFEALAQHLNQDQNKNRLIGNITAHQSEKNICIAQSRLVVLSGVNDLTVVETPDAVLVSDRAANQEIKDVVKGLAQSQPNLVTEHKQVHRPWGKYDSLAVGERFQVKRIEVAPQQKLSLQLHHHRSEHWIVVRGTARVTLDDQEFLLTENESTYIPIGSKHSLENPGKVPLELIEIQSGNYLGEDDIVRFEDRYGRAGS